MGTATILVIDDEAELREEVVDWLQFEGYDVYSAGDGVEGIRLACEHRPDLIVSDIMMPAVDGYRVLSEVRMRPETSTIPFIFVSALADLREVRHRTGNLSADDYIVKPFARQELLEAVRIQADRSGDNLLPCGQGGGRTVAWRECRAAL